MLNQEEEMMETREELSQPNQDNLYNDIYDLVIKVVNHLVLEGQGLEG